MKRREQALVDADLVRGELAAAIRAEVAAVISRQQKADQRGGSTMIATVSHTSRGERRTRKWAQCSDPRCPYMFFPSSAKKRQCYGHFEADGGRPPRAGSDWTKSRRRSKFYRDAPEFSRRYSDERPVRGPTKKRKLVQRY